MADTGEKVNLKTLDLWNNVKGVNVEQRKKKKGEWQDAIEETIAAVTRHIEYWDRFIESGKDHPAEKCDSWKWQAADRYHLTLRVKRKVMDEKTSIAKHEVRTALEGWIKYLSAIDLKEPQLDVGFVNQCYYHVKDFTEPGKRGNPHKEIKTVSEGGMSYWSDKSHKWIKPYRNKSKEWVLPEE